MEISFVNKSKTIQPQQVQDQASDPARNINTEENKKYVIKNKVDSAEISSSHTGSFDDKRLSVAKSAILYDVTVNTSASNINEIKNRIEKGTYDVPANLLADAMLK
ncbi:flagellar biosynthesis anti-sigma factor FlgM [Sinanaerobacter chloroacetimidivorans]|uniref:Flagellar biosynthesis anti-sigma factor FlgM n=1 Tax=Sinanaerobacter chloroacetimidivorans TaxID=2818044 RepID=A0A8J7VYQ4_9FIRM|nr:flagellar biosynthesis anti-sigma factor FlgM [Sinanaerobacter chloroacetimidivorans]MBR0597524.1 flagellar biosynthesis anti-sigma factor FlgM [Sinanaerobacter chloroacetimidivorans]